MTEDKIVYKLLTRISVTTSWLPRVTFSTPGNGISLSPIRPKRVPTVVLYSYLSCSQVVTVLKTVLPDGCDIRFRSDLVGSRGTRLLLVLDGRDQLTPWRVCVFYILLEAFGAQFASGTGPRASPWALGPGFRCPRAAPLPELLVIVSTQPLRQHRQR